MLIRFFHFDFSPQLRLVLLITDTRMYFSTQIIFTSTRYSLFTLLLRLFVLRPHTHLLYYSNYLYFNQVFMYFTTQIIGTSTRHSFTLLLRLFVLRPGAHLLYYSDYWYFPRYSCTLLLRLLVLRPGIHLL